MSGPLFYTPKYNNGSTFTKYVSPKEGEVILARIVPPTDDSGKWCEFHAYHWGYRVPMKSDPAKTRNELFKCPRDIDPRTKTVRKGCSECAKNDRNEEELKKNTAQLEAEGKTPEEIKNLLAPRLAHKQKHNREAKWFMAVQLAADLSSQNLKAGDFCVVMLSTKTKKGELLPAIEKYVAEEDGKDPLLEGVVWSMTAHGKKIEKLDKVEPVMEDVEVDVGGKKKKLKQIKVWPWTEADAKIVKEKKPDLVTPDRYIVLSDDQIRLLTQSSGDPEEVQGIMALGMRVTKASRPDIAPAAGPAREEAASDEEDDGSSFSPAVASDKAAVTVDPAAAGGEEEDLNKLSDEDFNRRFVQKVG